MDPSLKATRDAESFRSKIPRKCDESVEMKKLFFSEYADQIAAMSREMAARFQQGRKLLVMGNGGSLCDALHFGVEFTHPIIEKRAAFPVIPLMTDIATMTAIGIQEVHATLVHVAWDMIHIALGADDVI